MPKNTNLSYSDFIYRVGPLIKIANNDCGDTCSGCKFQKLRNSTCIEMSEISNDVDYLFSSAAIVAKKRLKEILIEE